MEAKRPRRGPVVRIPRTLSRAAVALMAVVIPALGADGGLHPVNGPDADGRIRRVDIFRVGAGRYEVSAVVDDGSTRQIGRVRVEVGESAEGPAPRQGTVKCDRASRPTSRYAVPVRFTGAAAGYTYSLVLILRDQDGGAVGEPLRRRVQVMDDGGPVERPLLPGNREPVAATAGPELSAVRIRRLAGGAAYELEILLVGDTERVVHRVDARFEEPFEGPAPTSARLRVPLRRYWTRFSGDLRFAGDAVGATYQVVARLIDHGGHPIGEPFTGAVTVSGTPPRP